MAGDLALITAACDRLLTTVRTVTTEITIVSRAVRGARRDLDRLTREIASLELTVRSIEHDAAEVYDLPGLDRQLQLVLRQCESVLRRFSTRLPDWLPGGADATVPWAVGGRDEVATVKGSLEAHRHMLEMNLGLLDGSPTQTAVEDDVVIEKSANSFTDEASETSTHLSKLKINEVELHEIGPPVRRSTISRTSHLTEKYVELPADTPTRYAGGQQSSVSSDRQTLAETYFSRDSLEGKELYTSPKLSQADLMEVNESLFGVFFVDTDAGYKVLNKYIPSGKIKRLLDQGANPDAYDMKHQRLQSRRKGRPIYQGPGGIDLAGSSALALAATAGDTNVLEILMDGGANTNAPRGHLGSALHAAAMFNQRSSVRLLLNRGADPNAMGGCHGYPIIAATRNADLRVLRDLLDYGADPNVPAELDGSALHVAISDSHAGESSERAQMLLNAGANPNADHQIHGTPLLSACYSENYAIVHLLLQAGADPNMVHSRRGAPLLAAVHRGQIPIATLLVEHSANKEVCGWIAGLAGPDGENTHCDLLSAAISSRRPEVVQWALRSGFGSRDYWHSGAFKNSLAKFPLHRDLGKLKIYPMIYSHARQRGHSITKQKSKNPLATLLSPRSYVGE